MKAIGIFLLAVILLGAGFAEAERIAPRGPQRHAAEVLAQPGFLKVQIVHRHVAHRGSPGGGGKVRGWWRGGVGWRRGW